MWFLGILFSLGLFLWIWRGKKWLQRMQRLVECGNALPGPYSWPILGSVSYYFGLTRENVMDRSVSLLRYGHLFRFWIGTELVIILANARDAEVVLSSTRYIEKSKFYSFLHRWLRTGLLTSTGEKWHTRRKIITPTFHFKILENFVHVFNKNGDILVSKLLQKSDRSPFDVSDMINLYTQDIICESAMGVEINAQTQEKQVSEYLSAIKSESELFLKRLTTPLWYFDTIFEWSPFGKQSTRNLSILHGMTDNVIKQRRNLLAKEMEIKNEENTIDDIGIRKRFSFLDLLLLSSEDGKFLSDSDIREEVDTFMFEGHDTVSTAICFSLYELSQNRDIQEKIYEELVEIYGDNLTLSIESLGELKYTEMVIKETLRLYPSVPILARNSQEEVKLVTRDVVIPPGAHLAISPYGVHRDPEFYQDPEKFNPDNFLPDVVKNRHSFAFIPFSAGPRNCIGQKFAMLELRSTIAKIVWNFILEPSPTFSPQLTSGLTLKTLNGIELMVTSRQK